jgi:hypothetical protein
MTANDARNKRKPTEGQRRQNKNKTTHNPVQLIFRPTTEVSVSKLSKGVPRNRSHQIGRGCIQTQQLTLMEQLFPLLPLLLATGQLNAAAFLTRAPHRHPLILPSRTSSPSTLEPSPLGLVSTHWSFAVSDHVIIVFLRSRRHFVVGSQPQLLERLAGTVAGCCCCLCVPEPVIKEARVHSLIHPSFAGRPAGRVYTVAKNSTIVIVQPTRDWPLSKPKATVSPAVCHAS